MNMIHLSIPGYEDATLEGYILDCQLKFGQETRRPAIVICPGGGYVYCSPREAEPVALRYASAGYHAFILRYLRIQVLVFQKKNSRSCFSVLCRVLS